MGFAEHFGHSVDVYIYSVRKVANERACCSSQITVKGKTNAELIMKAFCTEEGTAGD